MSNIKQLQKELQKKGYNIKFASEIKEEQKIRTGVFALDYVLGGGIGEKHRIEFWGKEGGGKSLCALLTIKKFQQLNKSCLLIDAERSFTVEWGEKLGLNLKTLLYCLPNSLEEMGDELYKVIVSGVDLVVVDSIISLIPEGELERATNEPQMALNAKINSLITKKVYSALSNSNTSIIFINQLREKIGVYGNPYTVSGGHGLLHLYDTRVEFRSGKFIEDKDKNKIGIQLHFHCNKNRRGTPGRTAELDFYFDGKIDNIKSLLHQAIRFGIIKQSGAWVEYKNTKVQGKEKLIETLTEKDWKEIEEEIWKNLK
ncbi:hypothetical protein DRN69_06125 [Candidatus Pacearchaeota archaeon]|nr:MAG: hypothetical protein DRN69_06125 [Candidatus Pacearchaeota archaeon]